MDSDTLTTHRFSSNPTIFEDKNLTCERLNEDGSPCNESFPFSAGEQEFYSKLGHSDPKSCKKHRQTRPKVYMYAGNKCAGGEACDFKEHSDHVEKQHQVLCRLHQMGKCNFGDKCKYSHVEEEQFTATMANAFPTSVEEMPDEYGDDGIIEW